MRTDDFLRMENVVSDTQFFHYSEMRTYGQDFINKTEQLGVDKKGPFVYALWNVPSDEMVRMQFFMPMCHGNIQTTALQFDTYYGIEHMLSTYVFDHFEEKMEKAYEEMFLYAMQNELELTTPMYHVVQKEKKYIKVMVGYQPKGD